MGEVYRATQISLGRTVALKILPPAFADRPALVKRFHDESMVLSTLNHPNIVAIIERGCVGKTYFLVMEYVDGASLAVLMPRVFTVEEFIKIAKGTAAGLCYAHRQGVVHRDIKPANIMVTRELEVKVADFGLAGLMAQEWKRASSAKDHPCFMGTPAYMSPEQKANSLTVDGRTDVFAAGVVFYELLTSRHPEIPLRQKPSEVSETADPRLDRIIAKCLKVSPDDRYQSVEHLHRDLEAFESELRRAPRCPTCGMLSPVRQQRCACCGEDLSRFFDMCPECKHMNRYEVGRCLRCGVNLEKGRTFASNKVSMMLDRADRLRLDAHFDEALRILEEVRTVQGGALEPHRQRGEALRQKTVAERREVAKRAFEEARKLVRARRFAEAVRLFKSIPPDIKDTTKAVQVTLQIQARTVAELKSRSTTNLIIIIIGLLLVMICLFRVL